MAKKPRRCACTLNQDGECGSCRTAAIVAGQNLQKAVNDFIESYEKLQEEFKRNLSELRIRAEASGEAFGTINFCRPCTLKYADLSIAKMIRGFQGKKGIYFAKSIVVGIRKKFLRHNLSHWPLTEKALADICKQGA